MNGPYRMDSEIVTDLCKQLEIAMAASGHITTVHYEDRGRFVLKRALNAAYAAGRADAGDRIAALEKALLAIKALTKAKNPDPDGSETARQLVNAAASNVLLAQTDKDQT